MKRAIVIRTAGDPDIAGAIMDGMTHVIPLTGDNMDAVIAENKRLNALNGVHSYGDSVRYETACKALAVKYATKPMGRLHGAILTAWACIWYGLYTLAEYLTKEV